VAESEEEESGWVGAWDLGETGGFTEGLTGVIGGVGGLDEVD